MIESVVDIRIDDEFRSLIPPLTPEELAQLERNIIAEGCRDALVVWGGILLDGHNRYAICTRHRIPFRIEEKTFEDREAAKDWIDANQLGRRNLTPDAFRLLLGRRYNRAKKREGRPEKLDQIGPVSWGSTASVLSKQYAVSPNTVKRAGKFGSDKTPLKRSLICETCSGNGKTAYVAYGDETKSWGQWRRPKPAEAE